MYSAESFRILWSDSNVLFLRASTGFIEGMFGDNNSTKCASRLIQMNTLFNHMVIEEELDPFLYNLACFFATLGYAYFHCYFMAKDMLIDTINTISEYLVLSERGFNIFQIIWFNFIWEQTNILNHFRGIQYITAHRIFYKNLEPTHEL